MPQVFGKFCFGTFWVKSTGVKQEEMKEVFNKLKKKEKF